jgi:trans-aconitate methyltransferase
MSTINADESVAAASAYSRLASFQYRQGVDLIELAELQPGQYVLDIGCGTGELTRLMSARVGTSGRVLGIDPDAARIDLCVSSDSLQFSVGSTSNMASVAVENGFSLGTFDIVFCNHVIHWVSDKFGFFYQCRQLLREGGRVIVQSPSHDIKLLTCLTKLAPSGVDSSLSKAICIAGEQKLIKLARAACLLRSNTIPPEQCNIIYRQTFDNVQQLFDWMTASTHGQWRSEDVEPAALQHFINHEFDSNFRRTLEARVCRLIFERPSDQQIQQLAADLLPTPPASFFANRQRGRASQPAAPAKRSEEVDDDDLGFQMEILR